MDKMSFEVLVIQMLQEGGRRLRTLQLTTCETGKSTTNAREPLTFGRHLEQTVHRFTGEG